MPVRGRRTGETRGAGQRSRRDTRFHRGTRRMILTRRDVTLHRRFGHVRGYLERGARQRRAGRRVAAYRLSLRGNDGERFRGNVERVERCGQRRSLPVVPLPRILAANVSPRVGQIERALRPVPEERDPLLLPTMFLVAAHVLRRLVLGQPPVGRDHHRVGEEGAVQAALGREHRDLVPDGSFRLVVLPPQFTVQREFSGRRLEDRGAPRRVRGGANGMVDLGRACNENTDELETTFEEGRKRRGDETRKEGRNVYR